MNEELLIDGVILFIGQILSLYGVAYKNEIVRAVGTILIGIICGRLLVLGSI